MKGACGALSLLMRVYRNGYATAVAALAAAAPGSASAAHLDASGYARGVLSVRAPAAPPRAPATATGLFSLGLSDKRDGVLYVPKSYRADRPAPLVVLLHGAGGTGRGTIGILERVADERGILLLAPDSRDARTWDFIVDDYGADVAFVDRALALAFERYAIDPKHVAIGGFSDGASYALSLGLNNGDLFRAILAFSPGFVGRGDAKGRPRVFVSHGTRDGVLSIDRCSRRIVPRLEQAGYDVRYREFDGPHAVPADIAREAVQWMLAK